MKTIDENYEEIAKLTQLHAQPSYPSELAIALPKLANSQKRLRARYAPKITKTLQEAEQKVTHMKIKNLIKVDDVQDEKLGGNIVRFELIELDADSWNRIALVSNREQFLRIVGHSPLSDDEVIRWVRHISKRA